MSGVGKHRVLVDDGLSHRHHPTDVIFWMYGAKTTIVDLLHVYDLLHRYRYMNGLGFCISREAGSCLGKLWRYYYTII